MKIGIDIRTISGEKAGKGWFTKNIVDHLLRIDQSDEYLLYTHDPEMKSYEKEGKISVRIFSKGGFFHLSTAKDFLKSGGDIFFAPTSFIIPALLPKEKSIIVVHDLIAFLFPGRHDRKATFLERLFLKRALRKAQYIICVSENTKKDLLKRFPWVKEKNVTVIHPAASEIFAEGIPDFELSEFSDQKDLPEKFLLSVSTLEPRKNLATLVHVFQKLEKDFPDLHLVLVGHAGWHVHDFLSRVEKHPKIHLTGYLPEFDLAKMYRLAQAFVFPSLYEGFGIPPLEAMMSGCPVICSNSSSLPEVVGDSALTFSPTDEKMLEKHIRDLLENSTLKETLVGKGKEQAKKFSWKKSAEKLLKLLT